MEDYLEQTNHFLVLLCISTMAFIQGAQTPDLGLCGTRGHVQAVARHAVIFTLSACGLCVSGESASPAGGRHVRTGALPRRVAECVAPVASRWFGSARPNPVLRPADTDGS